MNYDDFRFEFDDDGTLNLRGRTGWQQATCPVCHEPILWVLDMATFLSLENGSYRYAHARCAWTPEAFDKQKRLASTLQAEPATGRTP